MGNQKRKKLFKSESGQATLEYVLALGMAIFFASLFASALRGSLFKLWGYYTRNIVAGCPGCTYDSKYRVR